MIVNYLQPEQFYVLPLNIHKVFNPTNALWSLDKCCKHYTDIPKDERKLSFRYSAL